MLRGSVEADRARDPRYVRDHEEEDEHARSRTRTRTRTRTTTRTQRSHGAADGMDMDRPLLDFERLDVYRCAIEFLALAVRVTGRVPRGHADLRDQLRRASTSIPLNI